MDKKMLLLILLFISVAVTIVGLGCSAYNYYVFDKEFINSTTKGLLTAFIMGTSMIIIGLAHTE